MIETLPINKIFKWKCKDHDHLIISEKKPTKCPKCGCKEISLLVRIFQVETK